MRSGTMAPLPDTRAAALAAAGKHSGDAAAAYACLAARLGIRDGTQRGELLSDVTEALEICTDPGIRRSLLTTRSWIRLAGAFSAPALHHWSVGAPTAAAALREALADIDDCRQEQVRERIWRLATELSGSVEALSLPQACKAMLAWRAAPRPALQAAASADLPPAWRNTAGRLTGHLAAAASDCDDPVDQLQMAMIITAAAWRESSAETAHQALALLDRALGAADEETPALLRSILYTAIADARTALADASAAIDMAGALEEAARAVSAAQLGLETGSGMPAAEIFAGNVAAAALLWLGDRTDREALLADAARQAERTGELCRSMPPDEYAGDLWIADSLRLSARLRLARQLSAGSAGRFLNAIVPPWRPVKAGVAGQ